MMSSISPVVPHKAVADHGWQSEPTDGHIKSTRTFHKSCSVRNLIGQSVGLDLRCLRAEHAKHGTGRSP